MVNIWRCSKGHSVILPEGIDYSSFRFDFLWPDAPNGRTTAETQVCPICFANWIDANIPRMRPVISEESVKKDELDKGLPPIPDDKIAMLPQSVREKAEADATRFLERIRPGCMIVGLIIFLVGALGLLLSRCL